MDKTLMRPLFRKKAEQLRKVDGKKVPGYFIGGLIPLGSAAMAGIRTMAAPTYRYLAPKVGQFFAKPSVQTGLTGLETYGIASGTREAAEGVSEGDAGKVLSGLSMAVPGAAFLPYSAKRSGIAALRETGEFLQSKARPGVELMQKYPGRTALGSIGAGVTGQAFADEPSMQPPQGMSMQDYKKDVQDRLIYSKPEYSTEITTEDQTPELLKPSRVTGIKNPKTEGEKTLNKQIQDVNKINDVADKLGITDATKMTDKQIKQVAIESNVTEQQVRGYLNVPKTTGQPTPPSPGTQTAANAANLQSGNYNDGEVQALVNDRSKTLNAAKSIQKDPTLAEEFGAFKSQLAKITGDSNDNLNNLIAMKAASQLLSGKTREKGVRGFLDVGGQALGASADMMFQLALAQKNQDMKLAEAFLKVKAKKTGTKIGVGEDVTVRVNDPSAPGGFINKKLAKGDDGKFYERKFVPGVGQQFVEASFTGTDQKPNNDKINFNASQLFENKRGGKMIEYVIDNALTEAGPKAAFGLMTERAFGTFDFLAGEQGGLGNKTASVDAEIKNIMAKNTETGLLSDVTKGEKLQQQYEKDIQDAIGNGAKRVEKELKRAGIIAKDYRPTEEDLTKYTKLALIEQRMKYIVANANKSEDRLTQKDIDNAAQRTQIIKFIASPREIRKNYENLREEFREKASNYLLQFKLNGGSEDFIQTNFMDIPGVRDTYGASKREYASSQMTKNKPTRNDILSTIPIAGGK
jgi:hypothetical protein